MRASAIMAFSLVVTFTFDLWPWKPCQRCPLRCWIFVPSFVIIFPVIIIKRSPHAKYCYICSAEWQYFVVRCVKIRLLTYIGVNANDG